MKVRFPPFLESSRPVLRDIVSRLGREFSYVSLLGTDTNGSEFMVSRTSTAVREPMLTERGFVIRAHNGINYSEYSFNELPEDVDKFCTDLVARLKSHAKEVPGIETYAYDMLGDDPLQDEWLGETGTDPDSIEPDQVISSMEKARDQGLTVSELVIDFSVRYSQWHISKLFLSPNRNLSQSYCISEMSASATVQRDGQNRWYYKSYTDMAGPEMIGRAGEDSGEIVETALRLLDADKIKPGTYDVICSPEISGLIAHEAFGHGVEADMFVKNRARAARYMGKPVASEITSMHDGAQAVQQSGTFLFDDEGTPGSDTLIIKDGILTKALTDSLSALRLGLPATGNGRRESYERKAYARMTNTFFSTGVSTLDEMIATIEHGYIIEDMLYGMEDPKNWGIQCKAMLGREIKNGKLTGEIVAPVVMTGYVPDLLGSISMVSGDFRMKGGGACGKGHKERVKVSTGGPYLKARMRLG